MKEETLERQISKFKQGIHKGPDRKRHDSVQRDEQKAMYAAHEQLRWSYAKIGSKFDRDERTVKKEVERFEPGKQRVLRKLEDTRIAAHKEELRNLLKAWSSQIKWPEPEKLPEAWGGPGRYCQGDFCWQVFADERYTGYRLKGNAHRVQVYCPVEDTPGFGPIREHLDGDKIWSLYSEFKDKGATYWFASRVLQSRREEMQRDLQAGMEDVYSPIKELEEVERLTTELTELRRRLWGRLAELSEMEKLPGRCSGCP